MGLTTLAPNFFAITGELSVELSETIISPRRFRFPNTFLTFLMHSPIVGSSFRQGMTTETSISVFSTLFMLKESNVENALLTKYCLSLF